jgi:hypothetical protein
MEFVADDWAALVTGVEHTVTSAANNTSLDESRMR